MLHRSWVHIYSNGFHIYTAPYMPLTPGNLVPFTWNLTWYKKVWTSLWPNVLAELWPMSRLMETQCCLPSVPHVVWVVTELNCVQQCMQRTKVERQAGMLTLANNTHLAGHEIDLQKVWLVLVGELKPSVNWIWGNLRLCWDRGMMQCIEWETCIGVS